MSDKSNFWNNWDFKSILQIALLILGFAVAYAKLEAKVESDRLLLEKDIAYIRATLDDLADEIKALK